ncbi:MAG: bifunctional UDP-N-acetylmuramoyl-L-alanyl-D-glutamate--2,6-diaminopimelate ligase MurE/UDP-N-acetylmuramoyl-tripeptide--D-alanyl-D-alanine ligase MurF [Comamonas sp.]
MTLAHPTFHTPALAVQWLREQGARALTVDSRRVAAGSAFVAWPGAAADGRRFVAEAFAQGAAACLVEYQGAAEWQAAWAGLDAAQRARVALYDGLKADTGAIAAAWNEQPSHALEVLAVTGTNGKTSTAWWLAQALSACREQAPCGFVGTLGVGQPPAVRDTGLTTPDPLTLHAAFRDFADAGYSACAIEASSIGLAEQRLDGVRIKVALYTNFSQDHLDYHGSMGAYWAAKAELFRWNGLEAAVLNIDDAQGRELAAQLQARAAHEDLAVWTYGLHEAARLRASGLAYEGGGLAFDVTERTAGTDAAPPLRLRTRLAGEHNVANLLAVLGGLRALGIALDAAVRACAGLQPVPGRMACQGGEGQPLAVVDFAHTPDAVEKVLLALRPLAQGRGGRLHIVLGCGGERDAGKRPLMAEIAERLADAVVITSDNPRGEQPLAIIDQMLAGLKTPSRVVVQPDRAQAIADTLAQAEPLDVVLIAGKGHEQYQEIAGVKHPFSDEDHARAALARRSGAAAAEPADGLSLTLAQAAEWLRQAGEPVRLVGAGEVVVQRVHTDSRSLAAGDLFLALRGDTFDAHDFLDQAAQRGARAVLAERGVDGCGLPGLEVGDSRRALGLLAAAWRAQFSLPLIAVTGSNGKTTVTQMLASVLRAWHGEAALATQGNFNNDIGLPLTLLRLRAHHCAAVVELGMNHPGEIGWLAPLAAPTVALVNNAQREHQEFMATVEAVARENGSVFHALAPGGTAVFPADEDYAPLWQAMAGTAAIRTFGLAGAPDVTGSAQWAGDHWRVEARVDGQALAFELHLAGRHNVRNALAVVACATAAGARPAVIARGIGAFRPVRGRSHARVLDLDGHAVTLIDDSYNANPDSVRAAIDVLAELPAPRLLVLGDMGEVGDQGPAFHAEVGQYAAERGIDHLWTLGAQSRHASAAAERAASGVQTWHADRIEALQAALPAALPQLAAVLVKGSRFMGMERLVQAAVDRAVKSAADSAAQAAPPQEQQGKKN